MKLHLYNSIFRGSLKPQSLDSETEKLLRQRMTSYRSITNPEDKVVIYDSIIKDLFPDAADVYQPDGLELYLLQKPCSITEFITKPIVQIDTPQATTHIQKFYQAALHNETTRLIYRLHKSIHMNIIDIDRQGIVINTIKSIRQFLIDITDAKEHHSQPTEIFTLAHLEASLIRLLVEIELLFSEHNTGASHTPADIYCLLLGYDQVPATIWTNTEFGDSLLNTEKKESKPSPKKTAAKWLHLKEEHHGDLVDLFNLLKGYGCFDDGVSLAHFRKVFNGQKPDTPFVWKGYLGDLRSLIVELKSQEKIKPINGHWQVVAKTFCDDQGVLIDATKLRTCKPTDNHDMISKNVSYL